jgi:hypothetical protein
MILKIICDIELTFVLGSFPTLWFNYILDLLPLNAFLASEDVTF